MSKWMIEQEAAHYAHVLFPLCGVTGKAAGSLCGSEAGLEGHDTSSDDLREQFAELERWFRARRLSSRMTGGVSALQHTPEQLGQTFFEIVVPDEARGGIWPRRPTSRGDRFPW